ncbi:FAD/NAD-P-binding domain-containing protein [Vararia minispora EC-137]|uniref:FAD/NAD-P-binding domain-containing protein n=1 Tax=Vararia minispora EC-137 TaxID=1314806 RepID=A0ACB8QUE4_9AGAM|nr:FAD/NAD-P-binding domain-containing protein [Vararia minispora EC-137]
MKLFVLPLLISTAVSAWEFPFADLFSGTVLKQQPFSAPSPSSEPEPTSAVPRVAVIGAGAAGSSAAFWISKAKQRFGIDVEVDIFEKSDYVGGRSTTVQPFNDSAYAPMELGASIFVEINKNMWRASNEFNLTRIGFTGDDGEGMGIWDGSQFLFTEGDLGWTGPLSSWYDTIKVLWRYGFASPTKARALVKNLTDSFVTLYDSNSPRWSNISSIVEHLGWDAQVSQTGLDYFTAHGVSEKFAREIITAATRVNYAQDVDTIHGLEAAVSLAASGAAAVEGGNWRVFDQFVKRSGARLLLNTEVQSIKKVSSGKWTVKSTAGSSDYTAVLLAAPAPNSGITLPPYVLSQLPDVAYIDLHVTLLSTTSVRPNSTYFGGARVPDMVLTTRGAEFNSLSYHGRLKSATGEPIEPAQWLVKIFSMQRVSDEWLEDMFGKPGWVLRKEWEPYPVLPPTNIFPPVKLDEGLYYINAFEPLISTMETETLASRNVVELMLSDKFDLPGLCPPLAESFSTEDKKGDFVYGWDCL